MDSSLPRWLVILSALALLPAAETVRAAEPQASERQIRALEERWLSNEAQPDVLASILADDFLHVLPAGFISKSEQIQYVRQHPEAFPGTKQFEELRVRIYGDTAIAVGIVRTDLGANRLKRTAFTDVFVRRNGNWLAVSAQELALNAD